MSYSESYFVARESWRDWRIEAQQLIRLARVSKGARVLEIGCGGGGLLRMLRERGACAVGVDTLETALVLARERVVSLRGAVFATKQSHAPHEDKEIASQKPLAITPWHFVRIGDGGTLPFCDSAFDAIIGQHVLEHIPDADAALREWARVLRPDGRIALATPNARYPDLAHFADADHARIFSPRELSDALAHAGFSVEACFTIFPFLTRGRALRGFGVIAHRVFQSAPYFSMRGRTILLGARKIRIAIS